MDSITKEIHPGTFYGRRALDTQYQIRNIPDGSSDSELSDDEIVEPSSRSKICHHEEINGSSDSDDNIPITCSKYKNPIFKKKQQNLKWRASNISRNEEKIQFEGSELLPDHILQMNTPYKLFSHFFTQNFITEIVKQSCIYSIQCHPNRPLTTSNEEIERLLGILLWTSIIRQPTTRRYWSPQTRISQIADVMTINGFEKLKKLLHFSDNLANTRSIDKILPVINRIREACLQIPLEQALSCDEQVISFKGRSSLKTYNPKKPHKWGYKMWVLSGVTGFSYNFELYAGKDGYTKFHNEPDLGAASNVVVRMSRIVPTEKHYKIYYDNYFSSLALVSYLAKKKIHSVATIRVNRLTNYKNITEKEMKRKGRGTIIEHSVNFEQIDLYVVQWYDNKIVSLISDYCGSEPVVKVKRFFRSDNQKKDVTCPDIITQYNRHMGGVDLQDSLLGLYPIKIKSRKWYHRIFYHMLDVVVVNAWLLDRRIKNQLGKNEESIPLLAFKTCLAEQLCQKGISWQKRKLGRPRSFTPEVGTKRKCIEARPNQYVQFDEHSHWPLWTVNRERCKKVKCRGKSRVKCEKCKVHLCFNSKNNCFKDFHSN